MAEKCRVSFRVPEPEVQGREVDALPREAPAARRGGSGGERRPAEQPKLLVLSRDADASGVLRCGTQRTSHVSQQGSRHIRSRSASLRLDVVAGQGTRSGHDYACPSRIPCDLRQRARECPTNRYQFFRRIRCGSRSFCPKTTGGNDKRPGPPSSPGRSLPAGQYPRTGRVFGKLYR